MSPEKWQKIKIIFNQAVEIAPDERESFLESVSTLEIVVEVRKLLVAESQNNFANPVANISNIWQDEKAEDFIGKQIGNYKITKEIGRGGMGIVFKALREGEDFSQIAALKLLKRGMDSDAMLRRFRFERQILASLEHPNIARLLDGGITTENTPFLAMEFVKGQPIDEFCDERNLTVNERLRLFLQVCAAVSFAHSRLVVHRDLKPSNIFVTSDGTVKLLDFGIAKILTPDDENLQDQTVTALGMMTPQYASPEQIKSEIVSTSSDIYSLGLILYELLTGTQAYTFPNKRPDEMAKIICELEPPRPSSAVIQNSKFKIQNSQNGTFPNKKYFTEENAKTTNSKSKIQNPKSLRGDLDNIILKSLRKEPMRRYASVEQFANDIKKHLDGLPVIARSDTFSYRFEKFVARNRVSVVAGVLIFLTLTGGIAATSWQAVRAERQKNLAEKRFGEVRALANSFVFKYHDEIKNLPGSTKLRETMVSDALNYLNLLADDETDDISLKIELAQAFMKVGDAQGQAYDANLGDTKGAIESYAKAVALLENASEISNDPNIFKELIGAYQKFGALLSRSGEDIKGAEYNEKAVALGEKSLAVNPENSERILLLAGAYLYQGDLQSPYSQAAETIKIYEKALELTARIYRKEPENPMALRRFIGLNQRLGFRYFLLGQNASETGRPDETAEFYKKSLPFYQTSLDAAEKQFALDPQNAIFRRTFFALKMNVAQTERELGATDQALEKQREALAEFVNVSESDAADFEAKSDLALAYEDLALTLAKRREFADAFENYRRADALMDEAVKNDANNKEFWRSRRDVEMRFGNTLLNAGKLKEALEMYRRATEKAEIAPMLEDEKWRNFFSGELYEKLGDVSAAQNYENRARDYYRKSLELLKTSENLPKEHAFNESKIAYLKQKAEL